MKLTVRPGVFPRMFGAPGETRAAESMFACCSSIWPLPPPPSPGVILAKWGVSHGDAASHRVRHRRLTSGPSQTEHVSQVAEANRYGKCTSCFRVLFHCIRLRVRVLVVAPLSLGDVEPPVCRALIVLRRRGRRAVLRGLALRCAVSRQRQTLSESPVATGDARRACDRPATAASRPGGGGRDSTHSGEVLSGP